MVKKEKKEPFYNNIILIPSDFSEINENAIGHGLGLAQLLHAKVCILHVINPQSEAAQKKGETEVEQIDRRLNQYKDHYKRHYPVKIELLRREGNILKVINEVAAEIKASLMVLGTHGKKGLQHLYGSYALKVVLDCPCPVVIVQKRLFDNGYRNIVVPIRNEVEARQSVDMILLMHKLFASTIHLLQAMEPDPEKNSRLKTIILQITGILDEKKIRWEINMTDETDLPTQVISHAVEKKSDLIMIRSMPGEDATDFSFSKWNERLMFNEAQIPILCINTVEQDNHG